MERKHLSVAIFAVVSFVGCASWWANTPSHIIDVAAIVTCVMTEYDKAPQPLTIAVAGDIALKCGLENADKVLDLVKAQKAAEARHVKPATSSSPPPCLSASTAPAASVAPSAVPVATAATLPTAASASIQPTKPTKPAASASGAKP